MTDPLDISRRDGCGPIFWAIIAVVFFGLVVLGFLAGTARAHEATNTQGQPLGWVYPWSCCSGTDCGPIPASSVTEGPDGYHVTVHGQPRPCVKRQPEAQK